MESMEVEANKLSGKVETIRLLFIIHMLIYAEVGIKKYFPSLLHSWFSHKHCFI